jgi:hypothetical protein
MGRETKLKVAFHAAFSPDGLALFVNSERKVRRLNLVPRENLPPHVTQSWSVAITHSNFMVPALDGQTLIVCDTSGAHYGLSCETGELLWQTDELEEGSGGIAFEDGSYFYASWGGWIQQLDTTTGKELSDTRNIGHKMRALQSTADPATLAYVRIIPAARDTDPIGYSFCHLDVMTLESRDQLPDCGTDCLSVSPDGARFASRVLDTSPVYKLTERPMVLYVQDIATGGVLARRQLHGTLKPRSVPAWSRDGRLIGMETKAGHLFVEAQTLEPLALVAAPYACDVVFSPDGSLICMCDWQQAKLIRSEDLKDWPVEQTAGS